MSDNSDQRETTPVGTWPTASSGTGTGFWGYNYQTHAKGTGTNTFSWDLVVPTTGTYEVKVRYPDGYPGAASNAQFTVGHAAGSTTKTVDQRTGGGTWVSLGSYSFAEGVGKSVKLSDAADGVVLADAVMLVRNDTTVERARRDLAYGYDLNGNLTTVDNTKAGASDYSVGYDELNRPTQVTETTGSNTATTGYTYDPVGRPDTVTIDQVAPLKDQFYDYTWDIRGLLASVVTGASAGDPAKKTTTYSYDNRGLRKTQTKGNGNKVAFGWFDNGQMASSREVKPDGRSLVAEHLLAYDPDGNRVSDTARVLNSDTKALDSSAAVYSYEPRGRVTSVDRSGAGASDESYTYSASSNITSQTIGATTTSFVYDRDRLQKSTVVNGPSSFHNHDPFGRLDTITSGGTATGTVVGRYVYDGFDRIIEQRTGTGTSTKTTKSTFDAWDRPATKADANGKTTAFSYLGLSSQLLAELDTGTGKQETAYTFDAYGQRLTQTSEKADGTTEDAWYGYNPHSDVETLTTAAGETKSTYGYTAYGKDRTGAMTGADKPGVNPEPYNLYRYNAKRWDSASGDYDMGFRTYNPGLNRFTSRDMYNGALADLNLGTDPWNTNRYTFAGGNPVTGIEFDGHCPMAEQGGCAEGTGVTRPASTVDASDDPTVTTQIGRRHVVADDGITFHKAYDVARSKLIGSGGGQGPEIALGCTDVNVIVMNGDRRHSCGSSDVEFADLFATEMCRQAGLHCTRAAPTGHNGVGIYEFPAGFRIGGGPESVRIGRPPQGNAGYCSFSAETRVLMADGTTKPISKIRVGDSVVALDPKTGKKGPRKVTRLWVHRDTLVDLELGGAIITTTEDHPFWNTTDGQFQRADHLRPGHAVLTADGHFLAVQGLRPRTQRAATAYNLTVDDLHTYYVLAGETPVLVHNSGGCKEVVLDSLDSFEQARNKALDLMGEIDPATREPYIGRLKSAPTTYGKVVGFTTRVNGVLKRFRMDYDPQKGPHINVEVRKGDSARRWAVPWSGTEDDFARLLGGNS